MVSTADTSASGDKIKTDAKRKRRTEQGNDGIHEHTSKKKMTVQQSEKISAKDKEAPKQNAPETGATTKPKNEAPKQIVAETSSSKAKKETQKKSVAAIASNSGERNKEAQKQIVVESPRTSKDNKAPKHVVAETVSMPSLPQKSTRKAARFWSPEDELAFFNGILSYCKGGKGLPSNMTPVFENVRPMLDAQFSYSQIYNKFKHSRTKFNDITTKIDAHKYKFDNPHEAALYESWKQIWGDADKNGDEHGSRAKEARKESVDQLGKKKGKKKKHGKAEEEGKTGDLQISEDVYNQFCVERDAALKNLKIVVEKSFKNVQLEVKAMLQRRLNNTRAGESGHWEKQLPPLSKVNAEALREMWRQQERLDVENFSSRLNILQTECRMQLEELAATTGNKSA